MKCLVWVALLAFAGCCGQSAGFEVVRSTAFEPIHLATSGGGLPDEKKEEKKEKKEEKFDPYHHSNYQDETHIAGGVTAEACFAVVFVLIIGSIPGILFGLIGGQDLTKAHIIESVCLVVWLITIIILFTNVLTFNSGSGHWEGARSLTIAEAVYLLSQILTTVGYGDMTPATPFSQVWVAINVILALCLYGSLISEAASIFMDKAWGQMKQRWDAWSHGPGEEAGDAVHTASEDVRLEQEAQTPLKNWEDVAPPKVDYQNLFTWMGAFSVMVFVGVMFWHYYPGENKTWLQAVYFSVITLSTVGFGAITAVTPGGFVFGAFWMLFGVATLAGAVGSFVEIMFMFKAYQRLNPDLSKLQFFKYVQNCGKAIPALGDLGFEKYEFVKFGVLLTDLATEDEVKVLEARFEALAGPDGKISRETIIQAEAPPGFEKAEEQK